MSRDSGLASLFRHATSGGTPRRCAIVALLVGTVLNAINQGDAILGGGAVNWFKLVLTFLVPYAVCTYGPVSAQTRPSPPNSP